MNELSIQTSEDLSLNELTNCPYCGIINIGARYQIFPVSAEKIDNFIESKSLSLCEFLVDLDISNINDFLQNKYYSKESKYQYYKPSSMLKLFVVKTVRRQGFQKTVDSLTEDDARLLGFEEGKEGKIEIPSKSQFHHFVKNRIREEGIEQIMKLVAEELEKHIDSKVARTDSTPLEASRYNNHAKYNMHYKCKMDKAHITQIGTVPIYMNYTDGTAADSPELIKHILFLKKIGAEIDMHQLDGGYDSFENHANIWYHLGAWPLISYGLGAVINPEGSEERINHWINKLWREAPFIKAPMEEKLAFLYEKGRIEQVGAYFRNKNLEGKEFDNLYRTRSECERIHGHIKHTVKFDIRGLRRDSKQLYTKFHFVVYQLLLLANMQNGSKDLNSFGRYY